MSSMLICVFFFVLISPLKDGGSFGYVTTGLGLRELDFFSPKQPVVLVTYDKYWGAYLFPLGFPFIGIKGASNCLIIKLPTKTILCYVIINCYLILCSVGIAAPGGIAGHFFTHLPIHLSCEG